MIKKLTLTILLSTGLMAVFFSCCSDVKEYWVMESFQTEFSLVDHSFVSDSTSADTLLIKINPEATFVAQNGAGLSNFFVNSSFATTCPHPGDSGLKNKLTNVIFTSNEPFNQFSANENLNSIIKLDNKTIQDLLASGYLRAYGSSIELSQKPTQTVPRNFTITFEFDNGTSISQTTADIKWK